jgi:hypothetical protein
MKDLKHTSEHLKYLKHRLATCYIIIATYAISHIYFCNIQMKHLKHKSKTPETLET